MTAAAPSDGAGPVRDEDAFDVARVAAWLSENATDARGLTGIPTVGQFGGGASNLTYVLRYAASASFPSGRDLVLRRPPVGTKAKGAHDMRREHDLQAALAPALCGSRPSRQGPVRHQGLHRAVTRNSENFWKWPLRCLHQMGKLPP